MSKRIAIIQGHPDPRGNHFGQALMDAYIKGAGASGHEIKRIEVAKLDFPLLRSKEDWDDGSPIEVIRKAQNAIEWAEHLVIIYPLWLGSMPALLKGFLEQVFRPGFAIQKNKSGKMWEKCLKGKTAHIVITMGMPALFYRWYFRAHSLKSLERNILRFCGINPIKESLIGMVESPDPTKRKWWLKKMEAFGRCGK